MSELNGTFKKVLKESFVYPLKEHTVLVETMSKITSFIHTLHYSSSTMSSWFADLFLKRDFCLVL